MAVVAGELGEVLGAQTDRLGRVVSERFAELPDRKEAPEYYAAVRAPIDLNTIMVGGYGGFGGGVWGVWVEYEGYCG